MPIYVANGRVKSGELRIAAPDKMAAAIKRWRDCPVKIHATRSRPQNDYYWSVVIARVQAVFKARDISAGNDPDVTNEVLKAQFMDPELVRTGQIPGYLSDTGLTLGTHTRDLNKLQFIEYLERVVDHAAEHWDTYIPPPDKLWREHAEQGIVT